MFFIRQEQSPNTAQGLVINCLSRGAQGFLWLSIWSQKWSVPACASLLLRAATFPATEGEHVHTFAISQGTVTPHYQQF